MKILKVLTLIIALSFLTIACGSGGGGDGSSSGSDNSSGGTSPGDLNGYWDIYVPSVDINKIDALYLIQNGTNLSGSNILDVPVTGTIDDNNIGLSFDNCNSFLGTLTNQTITGTCGSNISANLIKSTFYFTSFQPGRVITSLTPTFAWTSKSGADKYLICVMRDNASGTCGESNSCITIWEVNNITSSNVTYNSDATASEPLSPGTKYRIKIDAYSSGSVVDTTMDVVFQIGYYEIYGAQASDYNLTTTGHQLIGTSSSGNVFNVTGYSRFILYVPSTSPKILFDAIGLDSGWVNSQPGLEYAHHTNGNMNPTGSTWQQGDSAIEGIPDGVTMENTVGSDAYYGFTTNGATTLTVYIKP